MSGVVPRRGRKAVTDPLNALGAHILQRYRLQPLTLSRCCKRSTQGHLHTVRPYRFDVAVGPHQIDPH